MMGICMDVQDGQDGFEYAPVGRRLMAGLLDWVVAMVWGGVVMVIFFAPAWLGWYSFETNFVTRLIYYFGLPVANGVVMLRFMFNAAKVTSRGETFGHRSFGLRIVKAGGGRIGWERALARQCLGSPVIFGYFSPLVWSLIGVVFNLLEGSNDALDRYEDAYRILRSWGPIALMALALAHHVVMGIDRKRRGLHDAVLGTVVVRDPSG